MRKTYLLFALVISLSCFIAYKFSEKKVSENAEQEWKRYQNSEKEKIKTTLKSYVDMAYTVVETNHKSALSKDYLEKFYGNRLKTVIDSAISILEYKSQQVEKGIITTEEAQRESIQQIKLIRFDNKTGYIWINDTTLPNPLVVAHPIQPELEGKTLEGPEYNCAMDRNQNLLEAFVEVCLEKGEGFVNYYWSKPISGGQIKKAPKISYVRLFKKWNWILGTGIYVDDAIEDVLNQTKQEIKNLRYDDGTGYFWINDNQKPYPNMVMHPIMPFLDGKILNDTKYNCPLGNGSLLFNEFVDLCESQDSGFVEYFWPKPTKDGLIKQTPKVSYIKIYRPLGWIIGTGFYLDSFREEMKEKRREKMLRIQTNMLFFKWMFSGLAGIIFLVMFLFYRCQSGEPAH